MISLTTADKALKDIYLDVVTDQLTSANPFLARIKQTTQDVYGNNIKKLVPYGINGGIGAGTESGTLPIAGGNKYARFEATLKNLYGTIEITDKAIRASQNSAGAFVNLLNAEMEGLIKASQYNFGRMLFGDGSGTLASVSANTGNCITVDSSAKLEEGMIVDIYSNDTITASARMITAIGKDSNGLPTVTVDGTTLGTLTATHKIYLQNSKDLEITGLGAIFDNSAPSIYGITKASNNWVKPFSYNVNGTITAAAIRKAIDDVEQFSNSISNFIVCSMGVRRALHMYMINNNIPVKTEMIDGGNKALMFEGIPVIADKFCPAKTMYVLNTNEFTLHQLCDWRWLEGEDGKILKQKSGLPIFTATLVKYCELICNKPKGQAMLYGITEM